jgi:serine/threonine-protein kinase
MPAGAVFCGECGERTPRRSSLKGMLLDGRYRIEKKLAAGGFGAIYRATHVPSGAVVALKVLHADIASDPHLSARFRREAAALASLRDPHTVTTYDHGQAPDGTLFIAMELLTGRSLYDEHVARGEIPWRRMLTIMRGVCSSLVEAHARGIVHRDLKPANIHLERDDRDEDFVKVLDFGIAKVLDGSDIDDGSDLTRVGQAIGTLEYMSPEQIVGGETGGRSDLYTLGLVAYEMITGKRPFADATGPTSLMTALMTRTPVPPSTLFHRECFPVEVDALILRCLARDPSERFASAAELAEAIDAILAAHPEPAPPPPAFLPATTLPGAGYSGPRRLPYVAPEPAPPPAAAASLASSASNASSTSSASSTSGSSLSYSFDGDEVTAVDVIPPMTPMTPIELVWEAPSRTPHLGDAPDLGDLAELGPEITAEGSHLGPPPSASASMDAMPAVRPLGGIRIAMWATALLAGGVGLGVLVASLL